MMNVINVFPWRFIIAVSAIKKNVHEECGCGNISE